MRDIKMSKEARAAAAFMQDVFDMHEALRDLITAVGVEEADMTVYQVAALMRARAARDLMAQKMGWDRSSAARAALAKVSP